MTASNEDIRARLQEAESEREALRAEQRARYEKFLDFDLRISAKLGEEPVAPSFERWRAAAGEDEL